MKGFENSKFAGILQKVKTVAIDKGGDVAGIVIKATTGNIGGALKDTMSLLTGIDSPESNELLNELKLRQDELEKELFQLEIEDRKSARQLYISDSLIQKILALIFVFAYFFILYFLFKQFVSHEIKLGEFEIGFISTMFGGMSTKINTIIDFFFGGSSNNKE